MDSIIVGRAVVSVVDGERTGVIYGTNYFDIVEPVIYLEPFPPLPLLLPLPPPLPPPRLPPHLR